MHVRPWTPRQLICRSYGADHSPVSNLFIFSEHYDLQLAKTIMGAVSNANNGLNDISNSPRVSGTYSLNFVGDWGGANFHRICSFLTQEFCDLAGKGSRTSILSLRDGGMDALDQLYEGAADLVIATPTGLLKQSCTGEGMFTRPMPNLRALATLPQKDRMVFALDPKYGIESFAELREQKPALRIATSTNDGTNFIGHVAGVFLEAHGLSPSVLASWGCKMITANRPDQCTALVESGEADALLQEAIMTPWWRDLIESDKLLPLPAEAKALERMQSVCGLQPTTIPAGFWTKLDNDLPTLDFSDFVVLVRDDLPFEVAYLLTWCLVEKRHIIEAQYKHMPPERSPLTYPLIPANMAKTPLLLHEGAEHYYVKAGHLQKPLNSS